MSRPNRWLTSMLAMLIGMSLLQCSKGKKSESQQVSIKVIPEKPIVITADTVVDGQTISNPWIKFAVSMTNDSTKHIVIVALTAKIYAPGSTTPGTWAKDPGSESYTLGSVTCTYDRFIDLDPGKTASFGLPSSTAGCNVDAGVFYMGGLEKSLIGSRYKIVLKPLGWFGTYDEPTDRYENTFTFYTQ